MVSLQVQEERQSVPISTSFWESIQIWSLQNLIYKQLELSIIMIEGFVSGQALALLFIFFGLAIAVLIKQLRKRYPKVPYTPTLFLISISLGYFSPYLGIIGKSIEEISSIDPRGILLIFLPPLIFESSFNSDWYIFRKQSVQIFILAFPSVLLSALFIMLSIKLLIVSAESYYNWPQAFMFGSVLSCTDTVAVLALLKEAGAPRKFSSLIEGESLFNDGTCMVLFTISLELVKGSAPPILYIGQLFLELTLGAIILGIIFGFISSILIKFVRNDAILTLNITVVSCYILYFTAQYVNLGIHISGIMSLVSMGLYMAAFGKTHISVDAKAIVHNFWKIYIFVAETIIFILGGVLVGRQALRPEFLNMMNWMNLFGLAQLYLYMMLARFLSITVFMWKLKSQGYGLRWKEVIALTHGGLRGAVGIAFTLILASNASLSPTFRMASLFNTSGCAFLTLMINAPTAKFLILKLGLCVKSDTKIRFFKQFLKECQVDLIGKMQDLKKNKYLFNSLWEKVEEQGGLNELKSIIKETTTLTSTSLNDLKQKQMHHIRSNLLSDHVFDEIDQPLLQQIRNRFCVALKGIIWEKFQKNQCSRESILSLIQSVNLDLDSINEPLNSWDYLVSHIHNPYFFPLCFWLKNIPIIGNYASKQIYWRVSLLYDIVSTYLEALEQCEESCRNLPFEEHVLSKIIQESTQNRKLAQSFLDNEIKISYDEIMKRIQTSKAAQSLLNYQKMYVDKAKNLKEIDGYFEQKIRKLIDQSSVKLESDSEVTKELSDMEILKSNEIFRNISQVQLHSLLEKKIDLLVQKDQPIVKPYEKQKYIYLIKSGVVRQEYKIGNKTLIKRNAGLYELVGLGSMLLSNKKDLQMSAMGISVVSVFCLSLSSIKDLMNQNQRVQEQFYNQVFLLHIKISEGLSYKLNISENTWKMKKHTTWYKKVHKKNSQIVENCYLILVQGKIIIDNRQYHEGYFPVKGEAKIIGPAKYYGSLAPFENEQLEVSIARSSNVRRMSTDMVKRQNIFRRTLYTRD